MYIIDYFESFFCRIIMLSGAYRDLKLRMKTLHLYLMLPYVDTDYQGFRGLNGQLTSYI